MTTAFRYIIFVLSFALLTGTTLARQTTAPPSVREPAAPATTPPGPAQTGETTEAERARELAEQMRRSRSAQQRSPRRTQQGARRGLLSINLAGMETFGDALGALPGNESGTYTVRETVVLGGGMFVNSLAQNPGTGGRFSASILSPDTGPSIGMVYNAASPFTPGDENTAVFANDSQVLRNAVSAYLGQLGTGTGGALDIAASAELTAYAAAYGIDPAQLQLNAANSWANFIYPALGTYSHAEHFLGGQIEYDYYAVYDVPVQAGGGGLYGLGRQKISENMTPLPTDRFIFDYSYYHGVPLGYRKMPVNRFTPGIEKTFFNKRCSVEFRLPFATTIDNTLSTDNDNELGKLRLGDMTMIFKYLVFKRERLAVTVGLALSVPLAEDTHLYDAGTGREVIRWENQTTHLMPYVGLLYLPGDRTFFQAWFQVDAATHGDTTSVINLADPDSGLIRLGRTRDRTFAYTSMALGYWVRRQFNERGQLRRGVNVMGELHWTQSLDRARGVEHVQDNYFFNIGRSTGNYSVLNLTLGSRFQLNENLNLGIGYAQPLSNGNQRQFDGELRLTLNRYF